MTDQLDDLFADLRAGALPTVRPPGADAARTTVRRRRQTRLAAAAGVLVLAVTGGVALWGQQLRPQPVATSAGDLVTAVRSAVDAAATGVPIVRDSGLLSDPVSAEKTAPNGSYQFTFACASDAPAQVIFSVNAAGAGDALALESVPCYGSAVPKARQAPVRVRNSSPRPVTVIVNNQVATGSSVAYAYSLVPTALDPVLKPSGTSRANALTALDRVRAAGGGGGGSSQAYTSEQDLAVWEGKFHRGKVSLRVSCVGPGTVGVAARWLGTDAGPADDPLDGAVLAVRTVRCDARTPTKLPLVLPAEGSVGIELIPDAAARNKAGYATAIG